MLLLSRKEGSGILIGDNIKVFFVRKQGGQIIIGIDAPKEIKILRTELAEKENELRFLDSFN